jgi:hypothetical protein
MQTYVWRFTVIAIALALVIPLSATAQDDQPMQILFMHHSTGQGLIWQGGVREGFTEFGYEFWDHGYNDEGLVDPAGNTLGVNWDVPGDNTDPDGWYAIFNQPVTDPPSNTLSHMLQADVIIFKSCFPTSNIDDEAMLDQYKHYYLSIRDVMARYPDKLFIPFTPPPLVPNETTPENAARAQRWVGYLTSDEYLSGHPNVVVFDFFSLLADENGYLRASYRGDEWDSHPNEKANAAIGPVLVAFVDQAVRDFVPGESSAAPAGAITTEGQPDAATTESESEPDDSSDGYQEEAFQSARLFESFEDVEAIEWWGTYANDPVTTFECELDTQAYTGANALRLTYEIPAEGSAGCGVDFPPSPDWVAAQGVSFYWRADTPGLVMRFALAVEDPSQQNADVGEATPFEIELRTVDTDWTQVVVRWDDLTKAEWVGDTGVNVFDPTHVVWLVFDVGYWETAQVGSIWIDDLALIE